MASHAPVAAADVHKVTLLRQPLRTSWLFLLVLAELGLRQDFALCHIVWWPSCASSILRTELPPSQPTVHILRAQVLTVHPHAAMNILIGCSFARYVRTHVARVAVGLAGLAAAYTFFSSPPDNLVGVRDVLATVRFSVSAVHFLVSPRGPVIAIRLCTGGAAPPKRIHPLNDSHPRGRDARRKVASSRTG